jgi:hypothetical protein
MSMRQDVEQLLRREGAPAGYQVAEGEGGIVTVEYPNVAEAMPGLPSDLKSYQRVATPQLNRCYEVLVDAGCDVELTPGERWHVLRVKGLPQAI